MAILDPTALEGPPVLTASSLAGMFKRNPEAAAAETAPAADDGSMSTGAKIAAGAGALAGAGLMALPPARPLRAMIGRGAKALADPFMDIPNTARQIQRGVVSAATPVVEGVRGGLGSLHNAAAARRAATPDVDPNTVSLTSMKENFKDTAALVSGAVKGAKQGAEEVKSMPPLPPKKDTSPVGKAVRSFKPPKEPGGDFSSLIAEKKELTSDVRDSVLGNLQAAGIGKVQSDDVILAVNRIKTPKGREAIESGLGPLAKKSMDEGFKDMSMEERLLATAYLRQLQIDGRQPVPPKALESARKLASAALAKAGG
jgi:hypothetical protein